MSSSAWLAFLAFSLVLSPTLSAAAQTQAKGYSYTLEEDGLLGEALNATPPLLRVRTEVLRVMLLRPRVSFVPELLETVERM